jgi:hypothetical protein
MRIKKANAAIPQIRRREREKGSGFEGRDVSGCEGATVDRTLFRDFELTQTRSERVEERAEYRRFSSYRDLPPRENFRPRETVSRWRPDFQTHFARRMSWCVAE